MTTRVLTLCGVALAAGCGPGNVTVSGRVRFPDGTPLAVGRVVLECAELRAWGEAGLGPDGHFAIPGLPPGRYAAYVLDAERVIPPGTKPAPGQRPVTPLVHAKFTSPFTSGLWCEAGRPEPADFVVDRP